MNRKHIIIIALAFIGIAFPALAQDLIQYPAPTLELKMDQYGGKNGSAVVYNPVNELYYCVIAGNAEYPLETFDKTGHWVQRSDAYSDMRGMWWNPKEKALEGNCYSDGGIISVALSPTGLTGSGNKVIFEGGNHQPGEHACGTFDPKKKEILYYDVGNVIGYSRKDGSLSGTNIALDLPVDEGDINWSTLVFTGKKGKELGVLDYYSKKIYLFNKKDGSLTGTVNLPGSASTYEGFNFSYANDYVFLFDQDSRKWIGYRIF